MQKVNWFKTEEEAKKFQKEHGGQICKNSPRSRTKGDVILHSVIFGFDPDKFRFTVERKV